MKLPLLSPLLATTILSTAAEQPEVVLTGVYLQQSVPGWAIYPDDEDESLFDEPENSDHMIIKLCVRGDFLPEATKQAPTEADYAVNEEDEWDDWEDEEAESKPTLTNVSFNGTLTDANGNVLHTGELQNMFEHTEGNILWWSIFADKLPDTMQLQLKGTLSLTAWSAECEYTEPVRLRKTAENYYWAKVRDYNIILETNVPTDEEEPEEDEEEEEYPFDEVNGDELPEPVEKTRPAKRTAVLRIEGDADMLLCVKGLSICGKDDDFLSYSSAVYNSADGCIRFEDNDLAPEHTYQLDIPRHKKEYRIELNQPLYLNGKK